MNRPTVILIRAGATDFDTGAVDRVRGWTDVPLNHVGEMQADRAGQTLLVYGVKPSRVVSSDLSRAKSTAERVLPQIGDPPFTVSKNLRSWNLGDLDGQTFKAAMPEIRRLLDHEKEAAPNGESFLMFQSRALDTLLPIIEEARSSNVPIIVVTHSRVLRLLKAWVLAGCDPAGTVDMQAMTDVAEPATHGGIVVMQWNDNTWTLADESVLNEKQEMSDMSDPFENAVREVMGFDYGGLFTGVANVAATGLQQQQADAAAGKKRADSSAAVQKAIESDAQWASAEATLEMAGSNPSANAAATTMRDLAKGDADKAGAALQGDGVDKRCQAAQTSLRNAAEAAAKSPKDASTQARFHAWQKVANACGGGTVSDAASSAGGSSKHDGESWLTAKHSGLPGWGWLAVGAGTLVVGVLVFRSMGKH